MTEERLSLVAPELAQRIRQTTDAMALRLAAYAAVAPVVARTHVADDDIVHALRLIARGGTDAELRQDLIALVDELDEEAFDIQDAIDEGEATDDEYAMAFARARAASAVVAALDPDPVRAAQEAAYEAHCAFEDGSGVLAAVAAELDIA